MKKECRSYLRREMMTPSQACVICITACSAIEAEHWSNFHTASSNFHSRKDVAMVTRRKADLIAPTSPIRFLALPIVGALMVGVGGYVIFDNPNPPAIPLWFVWLTGLFLWYVGAGVCIGGVAWALFGGRVRQAQTEAPGLRSSQLAPPLLIHAEALLDSPAGS